MQIADGELAANLNFLSWIRPRIKAVVLVFGTFLNIPLALFVKSDYFATLTQIDRNTAAAWLFLVHTFVIMFVFLYLIRRHAPYKGSASTLGWRKLSRFYYFWAWIWGAWLCLYLGVCPSNGNHNVFPCDRGLRFQ